MKRMDAGGYAACFDHHQLALMCANSDRTIDRLGAENKQLKDENEKLREFANEMFKEILLLPEYQMGSERKKHFIDKAIELGLKGYA